MYDIIFLVLILLCGVGCFECDYSYPFSIYKVEDKVSNSISFDVFPKNQSIIFVQDKNSKIALQIVDCLNAKGYQATVDESIYLNSNKKKYRLIIKSIKIGAWNQKDYIDHIAFTDPKQAIALENELNVDTMYRSNVSSNNNVYHYGVENKSNNCDKKTRSNYEVATVNNNANAVATKTTTIKKQADYISVIELKFLNDGGSQKARIIFGCNLIAHCWICQSKEKPTLQVMQHLNNSALNYIVGLF